MNTWLLVSIPVFYTGMYLIHRWVILYIKMTACCEYTLDTESDNCEHIWLTGETSQLSVIYINT